MDLLESFDPFFLCFLPEQVEIQERSKEKPSWPKPLRTLVVVSALGCRKVVIVIPVDVERPIVEINGTTHSLVQEIG